ncbi:MAG: MFS transporter [Methanomassiliicoccales archaeon]|nr:MAG: MFS transporter [Methanomassiliicoccales archaeon]
MAIVFVLILGAVSLLADIANEGTRSSTGAYLGLLGASAAAIGLISGLSELIGYGLRIVFGWVTDRTGRYWTLMFIGYGINLVAVPALALAGSWQLAFALLMIERVGRAIRGPARDAMISHASVKVGRGWAFGLQEALSSVGGMIGPMVVVMVLTLDGTYGSAFIVLGLFALFAVVLLLHAWKINPRPRDMEGKCARADTTKRLPVTFWTFSVAGAFIAAGYADFPLISFHLDNGELIEESLIPILYALAMAADALSALFFGKLYDKGGMSGFIIMMAVIPVFVPLIFSGDTGLLLVGMVFYGIGFGAQESIMRAIVADLAPYCRRGSAFGYYNAIFGASWFLGSLVIGLLYDVSLIAMVLLSMALQLAAVPFLLRVRKEMRWRPRGEGW